MLPQRVVHPQTGARYVPGGGRGVIPLGLAKAKLEGVIPRLYSITVLCKRPCDWGRAVQG